MATKLKSRVNQIVKDLKRVNEGEIGEDEARELFKELDPLEISLAEQRLLEEGMDPDRLREYCDLHLKAMSEKKEELLNSLPKGNPIRIAIIEHDHILEYLDELEEVVESIRSGSSPGKYSEVIGHVAKHLVEAEKHHEREEEVLFPRLEERDITGPPDIMREDHDRLWPKKLRLKELAELLEESGLKNTEKDELLDLSSELIQELRDHIFKENNVLYPTFVENIEDEESWEKVRAEFDEIGYCCFSPEEAGY